MGLKIDSCDTLYLYEEITTSCFVGFSN